MSEEKGIPKSAVKPLMEYCNKLGMETGVSAAEVLKNYLELMKKYADYFFASPWLEKPGKEFKLDLSEVDQKFVDGGKSYAEKVERFTVVCLRRNTSMEGFDAQGFDEDFEFYGKMKCWNCVVPDAVWLRDHAMRIEQSRREIEEEMKTGEPSLVARDMYVHLSRPEVIRQDKMVLVNLRVFEDFGHAEGRSCAVKNWYRCPHKEESEQLVECGKVAKALWRVIEWYDHHWNPSVSFRPSIQDMKWYHYDEPGILDVTSYDDVLKAVEDGRLERLNAEYRKYEKEFKS